MGPQLWVLLLILADFLLIFGAWKLNTGLMMFWQIINMIQIVLLFVCWLAVPIMVHFWTPIFLCAEKLFWIGGVICNSDLKSSIIIPMYLICLDLFRTGQQRNWASQTQSKYVYYILSCHYSTKRNNCLQLQIKSLPSDWHHIYLVHFFDFVLSIFQLKLFLSSYLPWSS